MELGNKVGNKIDIHSIMKKCRHMDAKTTMSQLYAGGRDKVWSWGANSFTNYGDGLRFTVQGNHFNGHIYIVLNGADLYDIYYCSNRGTIKMIDSDIFCEDLTDVIDRKVEYIPKYGNN